MGQFTYSSGVITHENDAGKPITAVAPITNGIRVSVSSHGYSVGDLIEHTSTTDYNGGWFVSAVPSSNEYDITNQIFPDRTPLVYTSSQTGTAAKGSKDPSGGSGLTGVTTVTDGEHTVYDFGNNRLQNNGALAIGNSDQEQLQITTDTTNDDVKITNSGILYCGDVMNDGTSFSERNKSWPVIRTSGSTADNPTSFSFDGTAAGLVSGRKPSISNQGSSIFVARYCSIYALTGFSSVDSANTFFEEIELSAVDVYLYPTTTNYKDCTIIANAAILDNYDEFSGVELIPTTVFKPYINVSSSTPAVTINVRDIPDAPYTHLFVWGSPNIPVFNIINPHLGTGYANSNRNANDSSNKGASDGWEANLSKEVDTNIANNGIGLDGVKVQVDGKSGQTYSFTTTSGAIGTQSIATAFFTNPDDSQTIEQTYYCKSNDSTDDFDFTAYKYGYGFLDQELILKGNGVETWTQPIPDDLLITEATKATVDAYTTIDNAAEYYDYRAAYMEDNFDGTDTRIGRSGSQADLGAENLVIDDGAASAYDESTKTIKSSTYSGGVITTGSVTVQGASTITGTYDGDVTYSSTTTTISNVTCTGTITLAAGTYILENCTFADIQGTGVTVRAINTTITSSGAGVTEEYYSPIELTILDGATAKSGALVGYWDDTNTDRTYSSSFVNGALTSNGSGIVSGYVLYRVDATTYTGITLHVGLLGYLKLEVPTTPTGATIENDVLVIADSFYSGSPSSNTTIDFGTRTVTQAGNDTTQGIYDYYIQQWYTATNLYTSRIMGGSGANFEIFSNSIFTLSSGTVSGSGLSFPSGSTGNINGGSCAVALNIIGEVNAADLSVLDGNVNMQGGTLDLADLTNDQISGEFTSGTIDIDSLSSPTTTQLDLRGVTSLSGSITVQNESAEDVTVKILPSQTSPTLDTSGGGTGTLTIDNSPTVSNSNILTDSYCRLYNVTQDHELDLQTLASSGYSYDVSIGTGSGLAEVGDTLRLDVALYRTDGTIYQMLSESGTLTDTGITYLDSQSVWIIMQDIHNRSSAYEGPNITGFSLDVPNIQIDISVTEISGLKFATWLYYQISTTTDGIRNYFNSFSALDSQNFQVDSSAVDLKVDNTGTPAIWVEASWTRDDGATIVASGSETIQFSNGLINVSAEADNLNITQVNGVAVSSVDDFKADVSSLETKAQADSRQSLLIAEHDATQAAISAQNDLSASEVNAEVDTSLADYDGPTKAELDAAQSSIEALINALNDLSALEVNTEVDTALSDYDAPTLAEMTAAFTEIKGAGWTTTDTLEAIRNAVDSISGGGSLTAADIWTYATRGLTEDVTTDSASRTASQADVSGLATPSDVKTQADQALVDYDAPTKAELDSARSSIESNITALNDMSESDLHTWLDSYTNKGNWKADVSALATQVSVDGLNDLSTSDIDSRLAAYDAPTLAEMTAAFTEIKGSGWTTTDTLEAIKDAVSAIDGSLTAADVWTYATRDLTEEVTTDSASRIASQADVSSLATKAGLNVVNEGVKKSSKSIPHNQDLP